MLDADEIVIAAGGGGIPVIRNPDRSLRGVEAVIDKDLASARLGVDIDADVLLILTAVENVSANFGRPSAKPLRFITVAEAEALLEEGHFGIGSMEPKIRASIKFLEGTPTKYKREVIITTPERAMEALRGEAGTRIVLDSNRESLP
jgi:carbamate kinase